MALLATGAMLGGAFGLLAGGSIADLLSLPPDIPRLALRAICGAVGAVSGVEFMKRLTR